jgi:hypothetical protein
MIRTPTTPDDEPLPETLSPYRVRQMLHDARHPGATYSLGTVALDSAGWIAGMCRSFEFLSDGPRRLGYTLDEEERRIEAINNDLLARLRSGDLTAWLDRRDGRRPERIDPVWWADRGGQSGPYDLSWDLLFLPDGNHDGPRVLFKAADIDALMPAAKAGKKARSVPDRDIRNFLAELDREYEGKPAPSIRAIREAGEAKFGKERWRKRFANKRNDHLPNGSKLYPNLYSIKSGPRSPR